MFKRIMLAVLLLCGGVCFANAAERSEEQEARRQKFKLRMQEDEKYYSSQELHELEKLYQSWGKASENEKKSIAQTILRKYPKSNRAGCILLYLAKISPRHEELRLLRQAVKDYNDCLYGDGVQVGAMARFRLGKALIREKRRDESQKCFAELRSMYPDAIDHAGKPLIPQIPNW